MKKIIMGVAALACSAAMPAWAGDVSMSGFATIGYAQSDQSYNYQRFLNNGGTFKRDTVIGAQMDARLTDEWGLTVQGKVAPSLANDQSWEGTISWAFLSWRPSNDLLIRIGRTRQSLYLFNENMDVGATFDFARLPAEMYTTSQTTDGDGISVDKTWSFDDSELTVQGYWGAANTKYRFYRREALQPLFSAGSYFIPVKLSAKAITATLQQNDNVFRAGIIDTRTKITDDQLMPVSYPYVAMLPGVGYYQTTNLLPGPGVAGENDIHALVYTLGADVQLGNGYRVMGEYVRRDVRNIESGPDTQAGYLAVLKSIGAWTPYISVSRLETMPRTRDLYNKVNGNRIPGYIPGATLINAAQRAGADAVMAYDQTTWAVGTSYRLNPTSKVKAEWARTKIGDSSFFVDAPPGGESGKQVINVFSVSYNVVF